MQQQQQQQQVYSVLPFLYMVLPIEIQYWNTRLKYNIDWNTIIDWYMWYVFCKFGQIAGGNEPDNLASAYCIKGSIV